MDISAGSTVSDPSIATATTTIVPVANDVNVGVPARYVGAAVTEIATLRAELGGAGLG